MTQLSQETLFSHAVYESPIGQIFLASSDIGLSQVAFEESYLVSHQPYLAPENQTSTIQKYHLDTARFELDEYFTGKRKLFEVALDVRINGNFYREILGKLREVSYGTTLSYKTLASLSSRPQAIRATGSACSNNPLPIFIGCHRVLNADGKPGRYLGGTARKKYLIDLEAGYI